MSAFYVEMGTYRLAAKYRSWHRNIDVLNRWFQTLVFINFMVTILFSVRAANRSGPNHAVSQKNSCYLLKVFFLQILTV